MTNREYFRQCYRLDHKINTDMEELDRLRDMSVSVSGFQTSERVQGSANEARFVRCIDNILAAEREIQREIALLVRLKMEVRGVIDQVKDADEQLILKKRYLLGKSWEQISEEMFAGMTTIHRWHRAALSHAKIPENHIIV